MSNSDAAARIAGREGLLALIAKWREAIKESEREVAAGTYSQAGCDSQRGRRLVLAECADELEAALSAPALSGAQEPPAWKPIATVPVDNIQYETCGTLVLLINANGSYGLMYGFAAAQDDKSRWTHWMPLPSPPDAIPVKAEAVPAPQPEPAWLQQHLESCVAQAEANHAPLIDGSGITVDEAKYLIMLLGSAALADDRRSAPPTGHKRQERHGNGTD